MPYDKMDKKGLKKMLPSKSASKFIPKKTSPMSATAKKANKKPGKKMR